MAPGQEVNEDNLGVFFGLQWNDGICVYSLESPLWGDSNAYTHSINFHDKIRENP